MSEVFEDVIYYSCDEHEGFYFLTSQERLLVFDAEFDDGEGVPAYGDFTFYSFPGHQMTTPPEAGQMVAGRYLVESGGRLLMVKRVHLSRARYRVFPSLQASVEQQRALLVSTIRSDWEASLHRSRLLPGLPNGKSKAGFHLLLG
ncbi:hypothetical protein PR202_gb07809 [Eleusine coracana subsp. coracana]|uniref:KIB1-4 beta-propeller domain-containing protein n=1 Tax=Eleusine coracana subsp. coracana TaxID=191504 RepID=A0AAV5EE19_ELECO|nr:hypothetical protein PR202_gb07809 [Eleusine coracana subsp. coracana]